MKKRIIALLGCLIFMFSFSAFADSSSNGITEETKKELLRYILYASQADSKEEMNRKHNIAVSRIHILDVNGEDMLRKDLIGDLYGK